MKDRSQDMIIVLFIQIFDFSHEFLYIPMPICSARKRIWASYVKNTPCNCSKMNKNSQSGAALQLYSEVHRVIGSAISLKSVIQVF